MPADTAACGHVRIVWPAEALWRQYRCNIDIVAPGGGGGLRALVDGEGVVHDVDDIDYDVIVCQRVMDRRLAQILLHHQDRGKRIVIDIDDDLGAVHPRSTAWAAVQPHLNPEENWKIGMQLLARADMITTSTPELAERYGTHGRVTVLPNCVPRAYLTLPKERLDQICVGWGGFVGTHAGDLQTTGGAVGRAVADAGAAFRVVGPGEGVIEGLALRSIQYVTGWVSQLDWPKELAKLDIGIAPLEESRFNRSKSWLKPLEYAALGVPFVASPLPDYLRLNGEGAGIIARKPKHWYSSVRMLIEDPTARAELATKGRAVAERHVYEDHAPAWWLAWTGETL